ncbi:MAG: UDP-N-acetylmuramate dehydrogenase [Pseudomonadales bacterium]|nr:UDP-N-acetylmuramate dehydrogenase [Pseudomonadales bacterium]
MHIEQNKSLLKLNTLAVDASARYVIAITSVEELESALTFARTRGLEWFVIGAGSNLILASDFSGLIIHNQISGREILSDNGASVVLKAGAGEVWHDWVQYTLRQGLAGLENLSLIPGTVGAAPVQNIGAYGEEIANSLLSVQVYDCDRSEVCTLSAAECDFAYRDSLFKQQAGRFVILSVTFKLCRFGAPGSHYDFNLSYQPLADLAVKTPPNSPQEVSDIVCAIRREKLPDPQQIPNVGSFFKNPVIEVSHFERLHHEYPSMPHYPAQKGVKVAAGWLIDQLGWKGYRNALVGIHEQQALVLINHGGGRGADILALAQQVADSVFKQFEIQLEIEPVVLGGSSVPGHSSSRFEPGR